MAWSNPPAGILYYNGFWFPELCETRGSIQAVYDSTGRFVKYTRLNLRVECMIYPGCDDRPGTDLFPTALLMTPYTPLFPATANSDNPLTIQNSVDGGMAALRAALTTPGGWLIYRDKGIGQDYDISGTPGTATKLDVEFGPKPTLISWEPVAGNKALRLVWEIEAAVPECTGGAHAGGADAGRIAEMSWGESYDIDAHGLTVHTQSGWLETVASEGKSKVLLGNQWRCSLAGRISVAKDQPRGLAWAAFLRVVKSKLGWAYEGSGIGGGGTTDGAPGGSQYNTKKQLVLLRSLSITEEVFGRGMSFSMDWTLFTELGNLFSVSGMWKPIGTSWNEYQASMIRSGSAWKPRGTANLGQSESGLSQAIISLCDLQMAPKPGSSTTPNRNNGNADLFQTRCPAPEESWLSFDVEVTLLEDSGTITHYPLGGEALRPKFLMIRSSKSNGLARTTPARPPVTQSRRQPYYRVLFTGTASRLGHTIPVPRLIRFGGLTPTLTGTTKFVQKHVAKSTNCFLYVAGWAAVYDLPGPPTGDLITTEPNPKDFPA